MEHLANRFRILPFNTFFVPYVLPYLSRFSDGDVKSWCTKSHSSGEGAWGANDGIFFPFVLIYSWRANIFDASLAPTPQMKCGLHFKAVHALG